MKLSRARAFLIMLSLITAFMAGCAEMRSAPPPVVSKRTQMHMGTLVTLTTVASEQNIGDRAMQAAFDEIKRLERLLSTWLQDSELSQVNAEAGRQPVQVSRETLELVARSIEMAQLTHGGFNIALGPAIEAWSVSERQRIPDERELQQLKPLVDWTGIQINKAARTIYLPHKGMRIDVGGIGKGYAADRAVTEMKRVGVMGGVVALSGDIKAFGVLPDRKGFPVGIKHPRREEELIAMIDLNDEAVSTAGDYERFFERDGVRYHHILDPQTLRPAGACQSVTVIANEGATADGLDTGIFVLGPEQGMALVERLPGVEAIIIDQEGKITVSSGLRGRLYAP
ncbi:FAD:protein FMN transferase [Candidatus Nitrospira nitrificans]|uniref:FAD:protein FMN transferase n=1 Tax=Candidatus Nitrospira nitrificans TaxID=1742973 RepID=A0A0S4LRJ2_9BACT|nr:FAD:protein FMN transferase [Candidatus Nitrospira nitrificans]CUS38644.1 putative Thiamine biosynthesis lipoprotein ApbE [Candidatus Nitrospira nitrificans]